MKGLLLLAFFLGSTNIFGQTYPGDGSDRGTNLKVVYADRGSQEKKPAYFLNGKPVSETLLASINPGNIESINVVKDNIQIDNILYYGQIHIKTKSSYTPVLISLNDLKNKYTNLKGKPVVFMIEGGIINADYDRYIVDENNLLTIIVDRIENTKEKIDLGLIKLLTKSDENIKKSKEIRIRGTEEALTK